MRSPHAAMKSSPRSLQCQARLSAPETSVTRAQTSAQPGHSWPSQGRAAAPVRTETAGWWAARGGGGTPPPRPLKQQRLARGPQGGEGGTPAAAGRASQAEGQTAGKPERVSVPQEGRSRSRAGRPGPPQPGAARGLLQAGVHPSLPGHSGEFPAPSLPPAHPEDRLASWKAFSLPPLASQCK